MVKTGFRGERKGILTPFTYSPIRRLLPRRGGMWRRKGEGIIRELANLEMRKWGGVVTESRKKHPSLHILRSHSAHTQLLLATSKRGNVASLLFGKPPNPRRGTSWKKVINLTPITYYVLAGHIPSCCWLPQRGNCSDGKSKETSP